MSEAEVGQVLRTPDGRPRSQSGINILKNNLKVPEHTQDLYRQGKLGVSYVAWLRKAPWGKIDALADRVAAGGITTRAQLAVEVVRVRRPGRRGKQPVQVKIKAKGGLVLTLEIPLDLSAEAVAEYVREAVQALLNHKSLPKECWPHLYNGSNCLTPSSQ